MNRSLPRRRAQNRPLREKDLSGVTQQKEWRRPQSRSPRGCIRVPIHVAFLFATMLVTASISNAQAPAMLEFLSKGSIQKGIPLINLRHEMVVLDRQGEIHWLDDNAKKKVRKLDEPYQPATIMELRSSLQKEFGKQFEVKNTRNFLVVQPVGRGDRWANLFERCHRSFISYMSRRGVNIRKGRFPMIAIVYPDSQSMYAAFKRANIDMPRVAGIYSSDSNRVMTHDGGRISTIATTVQHEAAHQSAFNFGVHSRVVNTPKWITEGVGQMFEPQSMVSNRPGLSMRDRANLDSLTYLDRKFKRGMDPKFTERVMELIGEDQMFKGRDTVDDAYAISWAMMFYLAEREPKVFAKILEHTAKRPTYASYNRADRIKDFERIVGIDALDFSKRVAWFLKSL